MSLDREVHEQPEVLARWLDAGDRSFPELRRDLATREARYVVVAALGTSDNAARYAGYVWGMDAGLPVALATPSAYLGYGRPPRLDGALVVGLSQSGASPDLVAVLAEARRQGADRRRHERLQELASVIAQPWSTADLLHGPVAAVDATVTLPPVPEWLAPIVAIVAGQRGAIASARARGLDPERPRGLAKVTRTH